MVHFLFNLLWSVGLHLATQLLGSKFVYENECKRSSNNYKFARSHNTQSVIDERIPSPVLTLNHRKRWFTTSTSQTAVWRFPEVSTKGNGRSCGENNIFANSISYCEMLVCTLQRSCLVQHLYMRTSANEVRKLEFRKLLFFTTFEL